MEKGPEHRYGTSMASKEKDTSFDLFGGVSEDVTIAKNISLLDEKLLLDMST